MSHTPSHPPPEPPRRYWEAASRHPLAAVIVGFVLTGIIGTTLTNHQAELRQRDADITRLREARRKAVLDMSRLMSERRTRMEILAAAITRRASPAVIVELKKHYDDSEANWLLHRHEAMLLVREVIGEKDYETFKSDLENRIARKRLLPLRECLERAVDVAAEGGDGAAVLREGRAAELLNDLNAGAEVLVDGLYELASISQLDPADPVAIQVRQRVRQDIEKTCP